MLGNLVVVPSALLYEVAVQLIGCRSRVAQTEAFKEMEKDAKAAEEAEKLNKGSKSDAEKAEEAGEPKPKSSDRPSP